MDTPNSGADDPGEGGSTLPPPPQREDPAPPEPEPVWAPSTWRGESEAAATPAATPDDPIAEVAEPDATTAGAVAATPADPFDLTVPLPVTPPPADPDPPAEGGGRGGRGGRFAVALIVIGLLVIAGLAMAQDETDSDSTASPTTTEVAPSSTAATVKHSSTTTTASTTTTVSTSTTVAAVTTTTAAKGTGVAARPTRRSQYGDDPGLDALYDGCRGGDFEACDDLYRQSDNGTEYEQYGDTCGNRNAPGPFCVDLYGSGTRTGGADTPSTYGDDIRLDSLHNGCSAGDMGACDRLYAESASGTEYERFAATCGNRNDPAGSCVALYS